MFPWMMFPWLSAFYRWPLSGDVQQDIAPLTNLFSPQLAVSFAGNPDIEREVVSQVASYGRQLGILTDAVLAMAADSCDPAVERLRETRDAVEDVKARHRTAAIKSSRQAMDHLRRTDEEAFRELLRELAASTRPDNG
ncbi:MAG: hypothetical protein JJU06_15415 [Ectothiorhodospiraceae bacterium]|nr:hypothetical protein [Ectothiorhodospiraceae bacterium]